MRANIRQYFLSHDQNACRFVSMAQIGDSVQTSAIHWLVKSLKRANLWNGIIALYPFVGGNATSHSYNLKNPSQYQISWFGGITHNANGITGNGVNSYGDTGVVPNVVGLSLSTASLFIYNRTDGTASSSELAASSGSLPSLTARINSNWPAIGFIFDYPNDSLGNGLFRGAIGSCTGLLGWSRTSSSICKAFLNGSPFATNSNAVTGSIVGRSLYCLAENDSASPRAFSARNLALAMIGVGLTDSDCFQLNQIVQQYQAMLGRQVP